MTANDIITLVDLKEPNSYSAAEKLAWLSDLDGKIFHEAILTHEHAPEASFTPYADASAELLVPAPWGEDLYVHYLVARIAAGNAETSRYNQQIALYNAAYGQFWNRLNATTRPLHGAARFKF